MVTRAAADITRLALPPDAEMMLNDQWLTQQTFILWDLVHDRNHSHGDLPFDPFMIKQRMPYWMYSLEELRCDLAAYRETAALEDAGVALAPQVRYAVLFDRLFRFPTSGTRVRNYDGLGGQILFAWLHRNGCSTGRTTPSASIGRRSTPAWWNCASRSSGSTATASTAAGWVTGWPRTNSSPRWCRRHLARCGPRALTRCRPFPRRRWTRCSTTSFRSTSSMRRCASSWRPRSNRPRASRGGGMSGESTAAAAAAERVVVLLGAGMGGRRVLGALTPGQFRVVLVDRTMEIATTAAEAARARGLDVEPVALDLTKLRSVEVFRDDVLARYGRVDTVVHLVGGWAGSKSVDAGAIGVWNRLLAGIVTTVQTTSVAFAAPLAAAPAGRYVMVSSTSARDPRRATPATRRPNRRPRAGSGHWGRPSTALAHGRVVAVKALVDDAMREANPTRTFSGATDTATLGATIVGLMDDAELPTRSTSISRLCPRAVPFGPVARVVRLREGGVTWSAVSPATTTPAYIPRSSRPWSG